MNYPDEFVKYLRCVRGYSENTIRAYSADLRSFARWAKENVNGARWSTITRHDIDLFLAHQYAQDLKPTTTNRQLASISAFYRFMQREGLQVTNPTQYESRRKQPQTLPATISPEKIAKAYKRAHGVCRNMLGILASTGIRLQELLDLTFEDIDFEHSELRIKGKGSKERIVCSTPEVLQTLRNVKDDLNATGRIFYVSQRQARYMIFEALHPFCKGAKASPHIIRHSFATELAKAGVNVAAIARTLGHSHIETSQKYINIAEIKTAHTGTCLIQN